MSFTKISRIKGSKKERLWLKFKKMIMCFAAMSVWKPKLNVLITSQLMWYIIGDIMCVINLFSEIICPRFQGQGVLKKRLWLKFKNRYMCFAIFISLKCRQTLWPFTITIWRKLTNFKYIIFYDIYSKNVSDLNFPALKNISQHFSKKLI